MRIQRTCRAALTIPGGILGLVLCSACPGTRARANEPIRIVSPADGTEVHPGQKLAVTVAAGWNVWHIAIIGEDPLGFSFSTNPIDPYRFSVKIPTDITLGEYALTALGQYLNGTNVKSKPLDYGNTNQCREADQSVRVSSDGLVTAVGVGATNIVVDGNKFIPVTVRPARRSDKPASRSRIKEQSHGKCG